MKQDRKLKETGWAAIFRSMPVNKPIYLPLTQRQLSGSLTKLPEVGGEYANFFSIESASIVTGTHLSGLKINQITMLTKLKPLEKSK